MGICGVGYIRKHRDILLFGSFPKSGDPQIDPKLLYSLTPKMLLLILGITYLEFVMKI